MYNLAGTVRLFFATNAGAGPLVIYTDAVLAAGVRYHIVLWRQASYAEIRLLDTSMEGQTTHVPVAGGSVDRSWAGDEPFVMGSVVTEPSTDCVPEANAQGVMDEVRIFASKREPEQFDNEYAGPISPGTPSLVAYWQMNESGDNLMRDASGDHHLSVTGALNTDYEWVPSPFPAP